jgi:hypothetical protein
VSARFTRFAWRCCEAIGAFPSLLKIEIISKPRGVNPNLQPLLQVRLKKCNIVVVAELAQVLAKESPKQLA